eukprot:CAMPEP_0195508398 /NCGR_PEP_ID=MMETSP0794_2-20130614/1612_1 /TAXON_ID=515487 /ORGANISM="Stephanopyxis turris, Strain CCMP 815" /LENGTH=420 /DNA_ID=CAMNT_0040635343 /DNA_START=120 /DNA_END=1382 /DNA_ORIENTATION=-
MKMSGVNIHEDNDLNDLIDDHRPPKPLEMENLTGNNNNPHPVAFMGNKLCALLGLISMLMDSHPAISYTVVALLLLFLVTSMVMHSASIRNERKMDPRIKHDYSDVQSVYDLKLGSIDHWCIYGGDDGCTCDDPLEGTSHAERRGWIKTHKKNLERIDQTFSDNREIDVAFIGDSITEGWTGQSLGHNSTAFAGVPAIFEKFFSKDGGADYEGIALGISGDTSPNLLWRLQHNEMSWYWNPRVWWVTIGINDMMRTGCSEEVTLIGIIRIVEEIQVRQPGSIIVVNGLLPTSAMTLGKGEGLPGEEKAGNKQKHKLGQRKFLSKSVISVNDELKKFCDKNPTVKYFEPSGVFMNDEGKIDNKLMADGVHPTKQGYNEWAKAIVLKLEKLIATTNDFMGGDDFYYGSDPLGDDFFPSDDYS